MRLFHGSFDNLKDYVLPLREAVFIKEQNVDPKIELDDLDAKAEHFAIVDDNDKTIACARILEDGHIGRLAVLKNLRHSGFGMAFILHVMDYAKAQGLESINLHAQEHALTFYQNLGFKVISDRFYEANIPHFAVELSLANFKMPELCYKIDEDNNVIGVLTRTKMRKEHLPHRVSYIALCNREQRFLVEIRTTTKDYAPGFFDACIGGVQQAFEDRDVSALRELFEEVGVDGSNKDFHYLGDLKIPTSDSYVYGSLYCVKGDFITKRQATEVSGVMYLTEAQMLKLESNFEDASFVAFKEILKRALEKKLF